MTATARIAGRLRQGFILDGAHKPFTLALRPLGSGLPMVAQDVMHRDRVDGMSQVCQGTLDTAVGPRLVLFRHAPDKPLDRLRDTGSATLTTLLAPIKLLGNQSLVPAHQGVRRSDCGSLFEVLTTKPVSRAARQRRCWMSVEPQPSTTKLGFEKVILFLI